MRRDTELGKAIRAARNSAGVTQEELGRRLGTSRLTIIAWEVGRNRPRTKNRRRLEKALGVPQGTFDIHDDFDAIQQRLLEISRKRLVA